VLLDDPHPLVRLIATSALLRAESRGAHRRLDYPATDPTLDGRHTRVRDGSEPVLEHWD
jgi:L-aspartate oxidase